MNACVFISIHLPHPKINFLTVVISRIFSSWISTWIFFFLHVLFPIKYNNRKQYEQIFSFGTLIFPQLYCFELQSTNLLYWIIICVDLVNFMDHFLSLRSFICVTSNFVVTVALLSSFHQIEFMGFWSSNKS